MNLAIQRPLLPLLWFDRIDLDVANELLIRWGHKMGPISRRVNSELCHALVHEAEPVALTVTSTSLISEKVGGGLSHLTRANTIELSRVCASRPHLNRIVLRLWREFVFPGLGAACAISYQDAALHSGDLYRFDGWQRAGYSHSGPAGKTSTFYKRSNTDGGRPGRNKWIWIWPPAFAGIPGQDLQGLPEGRVATSGHSPDRGSLPKGIAGEAESYPRPGEALILTGGD